MLSVVAAGIMSGALAGCGDESPVGLRDDVSTTFWSVRTNINAATIVVGGTQALMATPLSATGAVLTSLPAPTFRSMDTTKVKVNTTGVMQGVGLTSSTMVIASLTVNGVTAADTTLVAVTTAPSPIATFTIQPLDSAKMGVGSARTLSARVIDSSGFNVFGMAIKYQSLDTTVVTITSGGYVQAKSRGKGKLVASTTSWGRAFSDTVEFTITNPVSANVVMYGNLYPTFGHFAAEYVIIGVNGTVTFYNYSGAAMGVTFDNGGTGIPGGNIASIPSYGGVMRTFPTAGTYGFKDGLGNKSTVVVLAN